MKGWWWWSTFLWVERHAWQTLESSFSMYYLVHKTWDCNVWKTASIQLVLGTFKGDQPKVCELQCNNDLAPPPSCLPSCLLDVKKDLKILCWALPPSCLPSHYMMSCTWVLLPGLPPPYLHTANDQKLEAGTTWEWGYTGLRTGLWTKIWRHTCAEYSVEVPRAVGGTLLICLLIQFMIQVTQTNSPVS